MSIPAEQLVASALSLPESERANLAVQLLNSLNPPGVEVLHRELGDELNRRIKQHQAGEISSVSLEAARVAVEQALSRRSKT